MTEIKGTKILAYGKMRGAHGQPDALIWAVMEDDKVLFHDTARGIYGEILNPVYGKDRNLGMISVRRGYLEGYTYTHNYLASYLR